MVDMLWHKFDSYYKTDEECFSNTNWSEIVWHQKGFYDHQPDEAGEPRI